MRYAVKLYYLSLLLLLFSCSKEADDQENLPEPSPLVTTTLEGYVQKGPFINGSIISVYELNEEFGQSGKVFTTTITNNTGLYRLNNISLTSDYFQIEANGFYFNEITGKTSSVPISLFGISEASSQGLSNVNVISHLEHSRINYLLENGYSFEDAKIKANKEVLKLFAIEVDDFIDSGALDISKEGEGNAMLLAISSIVQGYRNEAEMTELLANMRNDIREDGILSDKALGTDLINDAYFLQSASIKANVAQRYEMLNVDYKVPAFEAVIDSFVKNTEYTFTRKIQYPETSSFGDNILARDETHYNTSRLMISAVLPVHGSIKVDIRNGDFIVCTDMGTSAFEQSDRLPNYTPQIFEFSYAGLVRDPIFVSKNDTLHIDVYENGALLPTWSKTIFIEADETDEKEFSKCRM